MMTQDMGPRHAGQGNTMRRRGILAAAGAVVAGIMAKQTAQPVLAAAVILGAPNQTSAGTSITILSGSNFGGAAFTVDTSQDTAVCAGLWGIASGNANGVIATGGITNGTGLFAHGGGVNQSNGVVGLSGDASSQSVTDYAGVYGEGGSERGIIGVSSGYDGILGLVTNKSPNGAHGVIGFNNSSGQGGIGVAGYGNNTTIGYGVLGYAGHSAGVYGAGAGAGSIGVYGTVSTDTSANTVAIEANNQATGAGGRGIYALINGGTTTGTMGIYGANITNATDAHGIIGLSQHGHGLVGTSNATSALYAGLVGQGSNGASAANFFGNVNVAGTLFINGTAVVAGPKSAALAHPDGSHRLVYCVEAPESWLEDFGEGALSGGKAEIKIDPDFAAVAGMTDYHVFLTPQEDFQAHVTGKQVSGFTVQQTTGTGIGNVSGVFSWRIVAPRKDVKPNRLAPFAFPQMTSPVIEPPHVPDMPTPPIPNHP